jgi:hypothetical protein
MFNSTLASEAGSPDASWIPSSDLSLDDADVTLFSLAPNIIAYLGPIHDPFFAATQWTSGGYVAASKYFDISSRLSQN